MNIHLGITYRGRLRDMKRILVVKAMVLGAIACSISAIGFAAGVESTHIQDATNMQQNKQGTVQHEAIGWTAQILRLAHSLKWVHKCL